MWCPDDIGRDSWDWVGPPAWERACFNSPEWGGGSSPVKTEPPQIVLLLFLLLLCCCVCVLWCVLCVCSKLLVSVFKIFGPLPRPPPPLSLPPEISFFLLSLGGAGLLVELWPRFKAMAHPKCGFRLVSFCVSPGGRQERRKRRKNEISGGRERKKKARNFGPPTLRTPSFGPPPFGPPPFGRTLRAPLFLGSGPHPSGDPPLRPL